MHDSVDPRYTKIVIVLLVFFFIFTALSFFDEQTVGFFISYILLYRYVMLFAVVFLAGLFLPLPINVLLLAVGAFSGEDYFNFVYLLGLATLANVSGDACAFLFFKKYGHSILREKYVEKYSFFLRLEEFFKQNTNISIFVSRIIGILGTPVNFLAGYMKVSFWRFVFWDILGNFVFVFFFLSLGHLVGDKWVNFSEIVNNGMELLTIALLIYLVLIIFQKKE